MSGSFTISASVSAWARARVLSGEALRDFIADFDGQLIAPPHARRAQVRAVQNQVIHHLRMREREIQRDVPAVGKAEDVRPFDAARPQEVIQIVREPPKRKRPLAPRRTPMPARVRREHMKRL